MDQVAKEVLAHPEKWIGGELVNYGMVDRSWSRALKEKMVEDGEGYPIRTTITGVQLEGLKYFVVIGERFACNGLVDQVQASERPAFPFEEEGAIAFVGPEENGKRHEWHLIPKR